jgi:hypothetical protein
MQAFVLNPLIAQLNYFPESLNEKMEAEKDGLCSAKRKFPFLFLFSTKGLLCQEFLIF